MAEEAIRTIQQQFTMALDGLTRRNSELQDAVAQSRQQAANESAALRQEVRAPQRGSQTTGVGESQATSWVFKIVARLEHSVLGLRWRSGAMTAEADEPIPNATILEEDDRAASAQLYWTTLANCKGATLSIAFLAGDSEHGDN